MAKTVADGTRAVNREYDVVDVQQVRELIELMVEHGLSEIRIREGETGITLRRGPSDEPVIHVVPATGSAVTSTAPIPATPANSEPGHDSEDDGLVPVVSPMVGTFYAAPEPDAAPFVKVGSEISADTTVCIIEAMKVFNEIKAEVAGTVERLLVQNEQAVEYGQPLMLVRSKG